MFKEVSDAEVAAQDKKRKKKLKRVVDDEIFFPPHLSMSDVNHQQQHLHSNFDVAAL